jgi:hypothetical protein
MTNIKFYLYSVVVNDMNPSIIYCFSETQNYTRKLFTKSLNCVESLNEAHKYMSLELHYRNNVTINLQKIQVYIIMFLNNLSVGISSFIVSFQIKLLKYFTFLYLMFI